MPGASTNTVEERRPSRLNKRLLYRPITPLSNGDNASAGQVGADLRVLHVILSTLSIIPPLAESTDINDRPLRPYELFLAPAA